MSFASNVIQGLLSTGTARGGLDFTNVGAAIGGIPQQIKDKQKEKEELARFNQISSATQAGIKASQDGNLAGLDAQLQRLNELGKSPNLTIDQQKAISNKAIELMQLRDEAKDSAGENNYKELVNIENQLNNPQSNLTDAEKVTLQARANELKKDPNLVEKLQQFKLNRFKFEKERETRQSNQWLEDNTSTINQFIKNGNLDGLENFISEAGEYTEDAQLYADKAIESQKIKDEFRKRLADSKRTPELDLYQEQFDSIPDTPEYSAIKRSLKPLLDLYNEAAGKWNPKTKTWEGGLAAKNKAIRIEDKIQEKLEEAIDTVNAGTVSEARREKQFLQEQIIKAEAQLEQAGILTPEEKRSAQLFVTSKYQNVRANQKPSAETIQKEVEDELQNRIEEKKEVAKDNLEFWQNYGKEEPVDGGGKTEPTQANTENSEKWNLKDYENFTADENALIDERIDTYGLDREKTIRLLLKSNRISLPKEKQKTLNLSPDIPDSNFKYYVSH